MKTLATFLVAMALGLLSAAIALVGTYDAFTSANQSVPFDHSKFLIETVASPRIVIDGGSSSMFGIVPVMIEKEFRVPVVVAADNASIPLAMKIHRIIRYARRGDILILPLEWVYYTRSEMPSDFIDKTPDEYASYYGSLPFLDRLRFVVQSVSIHNVSDAFRLYAKPSLERDHVENIGKLLKSFPYGDRKDDSRRRSSVAGLVCSDYLGSEGPIVEDMRWAARELRQLQDRRGVRVYITWPAIAGEGCYRNEDLQRDARKMFADNGIATVGDLADSAFAASHMLDTYYHVDNAAAEIRTRRLIDRLSRTPGFSEFDDHAYRSTIDQGAAAFQVLADRYPPSMK
ncbi:hypothetical protein RPMA_03580 [Tardiphaga alba]|uniref:SGNH/GDSL hydrolase family protein n=1 Tax=Tardiphaga alba TaxID=340268 RepID=A0ABX8A387_9BRAD|nr:hypothetical protein [Tardiphaga alba]QUS38041.1 hypothetical protein RPMA_03580 [Tardiphaga alba]